MRKSKLLAIAAAFTAALLGAACEDETTQSSPEVCPYPVEGLKTATLEIEGSDVAFNLVRVEPGSFIMGSDGDDTLLARPNERPAHKVNINKAFYIGTTTVTRKQWHTVMGTLHDMDFDSADYPMTNISMTQASEFCVRLGQLKQRQVSLPSEAQWEYAARGGHVAPAPQTLYAGSNDLEKVAWYYGNSWMEFKKNGVITQERRIHPVAQKWPNALGLYDMTGNVWEWTSSGFAWYTEDELDDPAGDTENSNYAVRGACWMNNANRCRLAIRTEIDGMKQDYKIGFRIMIVE